MKTIKFITFIAITLTLSINAFAKPQNSPAQNTGKAYLGVRIDPRPLPELLCKHLKLKNCQGLRISNVQQDSPADKAGLEKDDIIISANGKNIARYDDLAKTIQEIGSGKKIKLEIIHLGERKTITAKLTSLEKLSNHKWKYPLEPEFAEIWRPGKMFHFDPKNSKWVEVPFEKLRKQSEEFNKQMKELMESIPMPPAMTMKIMPGMPYDGNAGEMYVFGHYDDNKVFDVTIDGNPNDKNTKVRLRCGKQIYEAPIGNLQAIPKEFRETVEQDIEAAKKSRDEEIEYLGKGRGGLSYYSFSSGHDDDDDDDFDEQENRTHDLKAEDFDTPAPFPSHFRIKEFDEQIDQLSEQQQQMDEQIEDLQKQIEQLEKKINELTDIIKNSPLLKPQAQV